MRLLNFKSQQSPMQRLEGSSIYLRAPRLEDFEAWSNLRRESSDFLQPWEPVWQENGLTKASFRIRLKQYQSDIISERSMPFYIFLKSNHALVGGLTLSHIRRGVSQTCSMGYWMGVRHAGTGLMSDAVAAIVPFVFDTLKLNRLEAASIPNNHRSIALLQRSGFSLEGRVRKYLKINGIWQDHKLFSLLREDPRPVFVPCIK